MFFGQDRESIRRMYLEAYRKRREGLPLEPVEAQVADVVGEHPEYHRWLEDPEAVIDRDFTPEGGESNPFLHMGLHLAIRDQVATDRPPGIRAAWEALVRRCGEAHEAEHRMMEPLAEALWRAQRDGGSPDEAAYLEAVRRLA